MKSIPNIRDDFEDGKPLHQDPEVLNFLYNEIGFNPTTIANLIFKGEVEPNTIRYHLRKHNFMQTNVEITLTIGSKGFVQIQYGDQRIPLHRLLATLKVDNLADLAGQRVYFKDDEPFNTSIDNLSVGTVPSRNSDSDLDRIKELVESPQSHGDANEVVAMMESQGYSDRETQEVAALSAD